MTRAMRALPLVTLGVALAASQAVAQAPRGGRPLSDYAALNHACEEARDVGRRELYQVSVATGDWHFGAYDNGREALPVDARPSLRVLAGVAAFLPSQLEQLEFPIEAGVADELRERGADATLRVGFFLGFDGGGARACLMRGPATQNLVRGDLAYVELVDAAGALVVRAEYDRLRAWMDDPAHVNVAGQGARAAIGDPVVQGGAVEADRGWVGAARAHVSRLVERCYVPALARGASGRATVMVRLTLDGNTGAVRGVSVELSTLNDTEGARCIAEELRGSVRVPALRARAARVQVRVPVTLLND